MKRLLSALLLAGFSAMLSAQAPLWDLAKDKIPEALNHGAVRDADGSVTVGGENYFGIPPSAFPDQQNFTVQVTVTFPELTEGTTMHVLLKQKKDGEDTGLGLTFLNFPTIQAHRPIINGMHIGDKRLKLLPNTPYAFTVAVRKGSPTYYLNEAPTGQYFVLLLPAKITALKVFGSDYTYKSPKEKVTAEPRGGIAGKGWMVDAPTIVDRKRPKLLFYGDSIAGGYRGQLLPMLEGKVYAYHWSGFVGGINPKVDELIKQGASVADFDLIFFNNGLHSLSWTPEKASDQQIIDTTRAIVRGFKTGAPRAKLFWIATTPQTARRAEPSKPVTALGDKNSVVLRINRLAEQVMKEEGVEVIDMYTPLAARLDLAAGDEYHWSGPAYKMIADAIVAKTNEALKGK
jgi:lysophospholipase L1-like esterase